MVMREVWWWCSAKARRAAAGKSRVTCFGLGITTQSQLRFLRHDYDLGYSDSIPPRDSGSDLPILRLSA